MNVVMKIMFWLNVRCNYIDAWDSTFKVFVFGVVFFMQGWRTPKFLDGFNYKSKGENNERKRNWGVLSNSQHFGGKGACWSFKMGLGRLTRNSIIHTNLHKPNNKLVNA